jgi:hypothetical protein
MRTLVLTRLRHVKLNAAGHVLITPDTSSQSPQNIYNLLYDIHKIANVKLNISLTASEI